MDVFNSIFYYLSFIQLLIQIAFIFCNDDGLILELEPFDQKLRYFNCSLISYFAYEDERLFCGGAHKMQFQSIRSIQEPKNYIYYINALKNFNKIIYGKKFKISKEDVLGSDFSIITKLIDPLP